MNREVFVFGLSISAARAAALAAVHAAQSQPGESEQAEGDRDADFVQGADLAETLTATELGTDSYRPIAGPFWSRFWGDPIYRSNAQKVP